ncbi:membrane protein [Corynebacterium phocae]|uniref:Membrane protein n=1 Tax=Corynebacterium phocae TaxID=161895 RepID=A0A1L7D6G1_9CORY|nr:membrane protein [Corynebacterium phocae]
MRTQWAEEQGEGDSFNTTVLSALDKAVALQSGTIVKYVEGVKNRNPQASHQERQAEIDDHFLKVVTGTGATAGGASAIPGVGFITGAAAIAGESFVFLEAATWYILASANLRGIDITNKDLRRALVMLVLSGARGVAVVDTFFDEAGDSSDKGALNSVTALTRFSGPSLSGVNKRLSKIFTKQIAKRFKWAWVGKLMPLGIGAVLGGIANRKLARMVMDNAHRQLDSL